MKALCAEVDKVEPWGQWCPLQKAGSVGGWEGECAAPPHTFLQRPGCFQPARVGWMGENKHEITPENYGWVRWVQREAEWIALEVRED